MSNDQAQAQPPTAAPGSEVNVKVVDECLEWAETGDMNCGPRTEQSIKVLAVELRRLRTILGKIAEPWLQTESAEASFRRRMAAEALKGINPPNVKGEGRDP